MLPKLHNDGTDYTMNNNELFDFKINNIASNITDMNEPELIRLETIFQNLHRKFFDDDYGVTNALFSNLYTTIILRLEIIRNCEHPDLEKSFPNNPNSNEYHCTQCKLPFYDDGDE